MSGSEVGGVGGVGGGPQAGIRTRDARTGADRFGKKWSF